MRGGIPSLGLAALLCACTVGPNYQPPEILTGAAPPPPLVSSREAVYDASVSPQPRWWQLYDDPLLDRLVTKALVHNTDLRQELANFEKMIGSLHETEAEETPKTSISASSTLAGSQANLGGMKVTGSPLHNYSLMFGLSYVLDLFGKLKRSQEEALASVEEARASLDQSRVTTAASTAMAYVQACTAGLNIAVTNRSIAVANQMLRVTERRLAAGLAKASDVAQARSSLRQTEAMLPSLLAQQRTALYMLAVMTGDAPSDFPVAVADCASPPRLRQQIPVGNGAALIVRRPDIRSAERKLAAAVADIGVNTAALYPSITLSGTVSDMKSNSFGLSLKSFSYGIGPMLSWNFPNVSVARAKIEEANATARSALANFDGTLLGALRDTESALVTLARDLDTERLQAASTSDAATAYAELARRYNGGVGQFSEVLNAENTWIRAQSSSAKATAQVSQDQVKLFQQLGGGWESAPAVVATPLQSVAVTQE